MFEQIIDSTYHKVVFIKLILGKTLKIYLILMHEVGFFDIFAQATIFSFKQK